jgi:hypothetical protein
VSFYLIFLYTYFYKKNHIAENILQIEIIYHWCMMLLLYYSILVYWCSFSHPFIYLVIIYITQWLVYLYSLFLWFLTHKIVIILILEHASLFYASSSKQSYNEALERGYSQLMASNTYNALVEQFPTHQKSSTTQVIEFILNHRLW